MPARRLGEEGWGSAVLDSVSALRPWVASTSDLCLRSAAIALKQLKPWRSTGPGVCTPGVPTPAVCGRLQHSAIIGLCFYVVPRLPFAPAAPHFHACILTLHSLSQQATGLLLCPHNSYPLAERAVTSYGAARLAVTSRAQAGRPPLKLPSLASRNNKMRANY